MLLVLVVFAELFFVYCRSMSVSNHLITTRFYKLSFAFIIFCFIGVLSFGQTNMAISESLATLSDSLLKSEISSFTAKGNSLKLNDSLSKTVLIEIPIHSCSDKEVHLSWSTFFSSVSTFIDIHFKADTLVRKLDSIFLVTHSHFRVKFPKDAYGGIFTSTSCDLKGSGKKGKFFSPHYKAFYSQDKRRLYIYMQGENKYGKCEVTWVIVDDKYYTRILDNIP